MLLTKRTTILFSFFCFVGQLGGHAGVHVGGVDATTTTMTMMSELTDVTTACLEEFKGMITHPLDTYQHILFISTLIHTLHINIPFTY